MSKRLQLQAQYAFREFIRELSAFKACHVAAGGRDPDNPDIEQSVEVPRNEALTVFLAKNPEFNKFRGQLLSEDRFSFIAEEWQKLTDEVAYASIRNVVG